MERNEDEEELLDEEVFIESSSFSSEVSDVCLAVLQPTRSEAMTIASMPISERNGSTAEEARSRQPCCNKDERNRVMS